LLTDGQTENNIDAAYCWQRHKLLRLLVFCLYEVVLRVMWNVLMLNYTYLRISYLTPEPSP